MRNRSIRRKIIKTARKSPEAYMSDDWFLEVKQAKERFAKNEKTAIIKLYKEQKKNRKALEDPESHHEEFERNDKIFRSHLDKWLSCVSKTVIEPLQIELCYTECFAALTNDVKPSSIQDLDACRDFVLGTMFEDISDPNFAGIVDIAVTAELKRLGEEVLKTQYPNAESQELLDAPDALIATPLDLIDSTDYPFINGWIEDAKKKLEAVPDIRRLVLNTKVADIVYDRCGTIFQSLVEDYTCIREACTQTELRDEIEKSKEDMEEQAIEFYIAVVRLMTKEVLMSEYSYSSPGRKKRSTAHDTHDKNTDLIAQLRDQISAAERASEKATQEKIALKRSQKQQISDLTAEAKALRKQREEDAKEIEELKERIQMLQTIEKEAEEEEESGKTKHIDPNLRYAVATQDRHFSKYIPQLRKFFPDLKEIARTDDLNPNNTDMVLILTGHIDHSFYWSIKGKCQASGTKFLHINNKNPEMILRTVKEWMEKREEE